MKKYLFLFVALHLFLVCAAEVKSDSVFKIHSKEFTANDSLSNIAEKLVKEQFDAYNARNIDAFLKPFSGDVELYEYPSKLIAKGKQQMQEMYAKLFNQVTNLHCELVNRMVLGNTVIDYESVTGFSPQPVKAIAIYTIEGNKITKVRFIE